jgi:hypothetical protein
VADGSTTVNASAGQGYFLDTNAGVIEVFLPTSPTQGDTVILVDYAGTFATNNVIVNTGGVAIDSTVGSDFILATNNRIAEFVYVDSNKGWLYKGATTKGSTPSQPGVPVYDSDAFYVTATGGTITTSGDFKTHTFTGDGTFVVSCAGNPAGNDTLEVLAVGGGGGGGSDNGGGGGAGSVAHGTSIPVSVTTYPITIGAGGTGGVGNCSPYPSGAGRDQDGETGTPTVFLGNTVRAGSLGKSIVHGACASIPGTYSNGGGGGGTTTAPAPLTMSEVTGIAHPAISGYTVYGGNSGGQGCTGSFPSGFPTTGNRAGGGAGSGACQNGEDGNPTGGGNGGNGIQINICGNNYYWGGGGAGGTNDVAGGDGGLGGGGGGGIPGGGGGGSGGGCALNPGSPSPQVIGGAGGANTGGGGGGAARTNPCGGNGGKGIVIIKYKFQN